MPKCEKSLGLKTSQKFATCNHGNLSENSLGTVMGRKSRINSDLYFYIHLDLQKSIKLDYVILLSGRKPFT